MQEKATQAKPTSSSEGKTETLTTPTIPLKTQFEQLQSREQGLTGEEARKRLDTYGPNDTTGTKRVSGEEDDAVGDQLLARGGVPEGAPEHGLELLSQA